MIKYENNLTLNAKCLMCSTVRPVITILLPWQHTEFQTSVCFSIAANIFQVIGVRECRVFFEDGMNLYKDSCPKNSEEVYIFPKGRLSKTCSRPEMLVKHGISTTCFPPLFWQNLHTIADNIGHNPDIPNPYIWLKMALLLVLSISEISSFTHTFHFQH